MSDRIQELTVPEVLQILGADSVESFLQRPEVFNDPGKHLLVHVIVAPHAFQHEELSVEFLEHVAAHVAPRQDRNDI